MGLPLPIPGGGGLLGGAGGMIGGGLLSGLFNVFGAENPADEAGKYLDKIPGQLRPIFEPYITAGLRSMGLLGGQYDTLMSNPSAIYNKLASGYKQSPGFNFEKKQDLEAANNAAAAGGMGGTPQSQTQSAQISQNLSSQDFHKYLANMMGLYGKGLSGAQSMSTMGFDASDELAKALNGMLGSQAKLAYAGAANSNKGLGGALGMIGAGIGGLF